MSSHEFNYLSKKTPFSIFVDPDHFLGFIGNGINKLSGTKDDPDDPDGTLVQPYIDRLSKVASFYTYMADYGDARLIGGNYTTGWTGFIEHYARIPPDRRRNIMVNPQEYWTLGAIYSPNFYYTNINQQTVPGYGSDVLKYDPTNATGITLAEVDQYWRDGGGFDPIGEREITREFARQAAMGSVSCPHLFPSGAPEGGLTPGSPGATIGTFKSVAKRFWNDIAEYAKSRGTECIIQYSDFGANIKDFTTIPSIAMRTTNATGHSWWRGDFWNPPMQNRFNWAVDKGVIRDLAEAGLSSSMYSGYVYNWIANIGAEAVNGGVAPVGYWRTGINRLVDIGNGQSAVAAQEFDVNELNYWSSKGAGALMGMFYDEIEQIAQETGNPAFRKGLAMIVQLDSPVFPMPNQSGGGFLAAQKMSYMKDPVLTAEIDILGPFGATDANVPNMRNPDQIWCWSSPWAHQQFMFQMGTGNAADSSYYFGVDEQTARFGIYTTRSQLEKRLFKRPWMNDVAIGDAMSETAIAETYPIYYGIPNQTTQPEAYANYIAGQAARLKWLENNTLPNVYWDARIGAQHTQGVSNNVRFWSAVTGNCLPAPCALDTTSPLAAYLDFGKDIHKNEVRIAIKKWMSEQNVQAVEEAAKRLNSIGFAPTVQKPKPELFADPDTLIGWYTWENGYNGATANSYKNRILSAASPYTLIGYGAGTEFPNRWGYEGTRLYFDAVYGASAHIDLNQGGIQFQTNGLIGGKHLPPYVSRAVMFNAEYPWLASFSEQYDNDFDIKPNSNDPGVIAEFARQAAMGSAAAPYLFPQGHPPQGLTPGSTLTNIGVYRKVGARMWNDLAHYAKKNTTLRNTARYAIHYAGTPNPFSAGVLRSGIRRLPETISDNRSYWGRSSILKDYDDVYDATSSTASDTVDALYASQVSADAIAMSWYNTCPSDSDWATGATFWFSDFNAAQRNSFDGTPSQTDYSFDDLLYWQLKEHASSTGRFRKALTDMQLIGGTADPKFAAIITPTWSYEGGGITPTVWNHWSGGRKNPTIAGIFDAVSILSPIVFGSDRFDPSARVADQIWIWDAAQYYWWDIPTKSTYLGSPPSAPTEWPEDTIVRQTIWARNMLEKILFGRPNYPTELKELMESDGISSGIPGQENTNRPQIQARQGKWLFDNSLTDGWWARNGDGAENRVWYDLLDGGNKLPSPCVLDQNSPLAPWLNFNSQITTNHIHEALKNYISDYNCRYVEAVRETIDRFYP